MNKKALLTAIAALTLISGGTALAQGNSDHDRGHDDRGRGDRGDQGEHRGPPGRDEGRGPVRRGPPQRVEERHEERGAGPGHDFRRGQRLPPEYRHNQYVVNDWRGHHLSAPPRGYHWVQTGGDYVLVAIPTGVIFQIHLGG
jgi:Ni/Co efflux regulator RcnB